ncbi:MAG: M20/M25/M40 family metallo-hydrolase, partial [Methanobacteriota archaeon]
AIVDVVESAEPSFSTPGRVCRLVCDGIQSVMQVHAEPGVSQAASDARYLRKHGAEVIVYGPGDLNLLHSVNENVPVTMLRNSQQVYEYVLKNINQNISF